MPGPVILLKHEELTYENAEDRWQQQQKLNNKQGKGRAPDPPNVLKNLKDQMPPVKNQSKLWSTDWDGKLLQYINH
jgi:hypothetical protein